MTTPKPKKAAKAKYAFEIIRPEVGDPPEYRYYWRCRHRNGHIVADGAEGYASKAKLRRALTNLISALRGPDFEVKEL